MTPSLVFPRVRIRRHFRNRKECRICEKFAYELNEDTTQNLTGLDVKNFATTQSDLEKGAVIQRFDKTENKNLLIFYPGIFL